MKIDKDIYKLFLKHGSECLWLSDSRIPRPKATCTETDEAFKMLEIVNHNFCSIATGMYSKEMMANFQQEVNKYKPQLSSEVLDLIKNKYL